MNNKQSFNTLFLERYPERNGILKYIQQALGKQNITFADLTKSNLRKVNDTILASVAAGTAKTYFAIIKAFISLYGIEYNMPCLDTKQVLHAKRCPSQNVYLTESEIATLEDYLTHLEQRPTLRCKDRCEIDVLHAFLAECYCGARGCDVKDFDDSNIHDGFLTYVSKKTKVLSQIPVHRNLLRHLKHHSEKHTSCVIDRVIKRICEVCGINEPKTLFYHGSLQTRPKYEYVGFHTARRSFATNLALRNVPLPVISQMMNHGQDLAMTQRYIVTDQNSFSADTLAFFQ